MSVPKSVVKVKKNGVEYTSNVDACEYYIYELNRAALRDVAKFVRSKWRIALYDQFERHTGRAGGVVKSIVLARKDTKYPRVEMGLKKGKPNGFYGFYQEFGTSKTPRYGILSDTVENNVAKIVEIESKYLSALEDEAAALALINEGEYEDDGE